MDELTIREVRPADVEAAIGIAQLAWRPVYRYYRETLGAGLFAAFHGNWEEEKARQVRSACEGERGTMVCVAESDGRVVGFAAYRADRERGTAEIGNNAVHPSWQSRGIGRAMYAHIFDRLRALGIAHVVVRTGGDPAHAPARRAYEAAGFDVRIPNVTYFRDLSDNDGA